MEVQVVLQIQAERGFGWPSLRGTGTYLNGTTGQNGRLTVAGLGNLDDTSDAPALLNLSTAHELGADGQTITKWDSPWGSSGAICRARGRGRGNSRVRAHPGMIMTASSVLQTER